MSRRFYVYYLYHIPKVFTIFCQHFKTRFQSSSMQIYTVSQKTTLLLLATTSTYINRFW